MRKGAHGLIRNRIDRNLYVSYEYQIFGNEGIDLQQQRLCLLKRIFIDKKLAQTEGPQNFYLFLAQCIYRRATFPLHSVPAHQMTSSVNRRDISCSRINSNKSPFLWTFSHEATSLESDLSSCGYKRDMVKLRRLFFALTVKPEHVRIRRGEKRKIADKYAQSDHFSRCWDLAMSFYSNGGCLYSLLTSHFRISAVGL